MILGMRMTKSRRLGEQIGNYSTLMTQFCALRQLSACAAQNSLINNSFHAELTELSCIVTHGSQLR
jgi:hypothetical protein